MTFEEIKTFEQVVRLKENFCVEFKKAIDKSDSNYERWLDRIIYDGTWGENNLYNFYVIVMNIQ